MKIFISNMQKWTIKSPINLEIEIIGFVIYIYLKLYSSFTVRYHWCCAPRYRLEVVYLHKFRVTQLVYGSVTLARCAALPYGYSLPHTISRGFLSILTVDFPALLRSSVNLTFGRRWCVGLMRRFTPLRPHTLPFPRRLYYWIHIDITCTTLAGNGSRRN